MATITEDYVSFETAKLLKEKLFNEKCSYVWVLDKANDPKDTDGVYKVASPCFMEGESYVSNEDIDRVLEYSDEYYHKDAFLCPTLQMAMKWLREVHHIFIQIELYSKYDDYNFEIFQNTYRLWIEERTVYSTYTETVEMAIKYTLEHLIK